ncbi:MAG: hypothetical protein ACLQVD_10425 [Capsulimonadaceae bacterium]
MTRPTESARTAAVSARLHDIAVDAMYVLLWTVCVRVCYEFFTLTDQPGFYLTLGALSAGALLFWAAFRCVILWCDIGASARRRRRAGEVRQDDITQPGVAGT